MQRTEQLDILTVASINNYADKEYWLEELAGASPARYFEADVTRPAVKAKKSFCLHTIKRSLSKRIWELCNESDHSLHTLLLSVIAVLLHKHSGNESVLIGTPLYKQDKKDVKLINTLLAIRTELRPGGSFRDLLGQAREKIVKAVRHQNYPFEILEKELGDTPLLSIALVLDTIQDLRYLRDREFDIVFTFDRSEDDISCKAIFDSSQFRTASIKKYLEQFTVLLERLTDLPYAPLTTVSLLTAEETSLIHGTFNSTKLNYDNSSSPIAKLIEARVKRSPRKVAIGFEDGHLTYEEWDRKANQLATTLRKRGTGRNEIVGILAERSPEMLIGILGIIKAGAAYLPLDPTLPADRIQFMLADSQARLVLKQSKWELDTDNRSFEAFDLEDDASYTGNGMGISCINQSNDLAYIIYTSGSTGVPKGVMIEHGSLVNRLNWMQRQYQLSGNDVILHKTPFTFDVSVWELFWWALTGTSVYLLEPGAEKYCDRLIDVIAANKITVLHFVPSMFVVFLDYVEETNSAERLHSLRQIFTSGEALSSASVKQFNRLFPWCELSNLYGPTEATIDVSYYDCPKKKVPDSIPIGKPIDNTGLYITDGYQQLQPIGVAGELCISGVGLARGYLNREELTREKFVNVAWLDSKVYRTGDLARWLPDGNIEYLGRLDDQVKIRGYRIELGEIEYHLLQQSAIKEAVVVAKQRENQESYLCAYIVARQPVTEQRIKDDLSKILPVYMIPHHIMALEKIPLTANGKVNRKLLPEPSRAKLPAGNSTGDVSPERQKLAAIWKEVLKTEHFGIEDNFFNTGGDSILAIRLISKVNKSFAISLSLAAFYDAQTFAELSDLITGKIKEGRENVDSVVEQEIAAFESSFLSTLTEEQRETIEAVYPMSGIEKGMCYHHLLDSGASIYFEQNTLDFCYHEIDVNRMCKAIQLLIDKHQALRTGYDLNQFAHIVYKEIPLPATVIDLSDKGRHDQREYMRAFLEESKYKAFDVSCPPLWRVTLFYISEAHMVICMESHHAILDGWSWASLVTELNNIYFTLKNDPDHVPHLLKSSFREFIIEECSAIKDEPTINFWKEELRDFRRLQLPRSQPPYEYRRLRKEYDKQDFRNLRRAGEKLNVQLKELFFAAYVYALKMLTYENDITVGLVSFSRPITEDGEKMLGCYLNTIPVRITIPVDITWKEYLQIVVDKLAKIRQHDKLPLMEIIRNSGENSHGGNLLFDAHFNFINFHVWGDLSSDDSLKSDAKPFRFENYLRGNIWLDFNIDITGDNLNIGTECYTELMSEKDFNRFFGYYNLILRAISNNADAVIDHGELLGEEMLQVVNTFNTTDRIYDESRTPLIELIQAKASVKLKHTAIVFGDDQLTYDELNTRANYLATSLRSSGISRGSVAAILARRSPEFVIAVLAALKAGAAFVPIDPAYPIERINYIIDDSGAACILYRNEDRLMQLPSGIPGFNISEESSMVPGKFYQPCVNEGTDLAYIIYTSGSTGRPKGVMIQHRSLLNYLLNSIHDYTNQSGSDSGSYMHMSVAFDASITALFVPLMLGKTLVISNAEGAAVFEDKNFLGYAPYDFIKLTPAHFLLLRETVTGNQFLTRKYVAGGEALLPEHVGFLAQHKKTIEVFNEYGPTEATVGCCSYRFNVTGDIRSSANGVLIGKPMGNVKLYVLDKRLQPLPAGVMGELFIGGVQVAQGYLNREELTAEKFMESSISNAKGKLYRTGDLACWLEDGNLEFGGRTDDQVKINGYRVEIGEIEYTLNNSKLVTASAVTVRTSADGIKSLAAYIVPLGATIDEIRDYLRQQLPEHMIPSLWMKLDELPLTHHGKIDRRSLPEPVINESSAGEYVAPVTHREEELVSIWKELFKTEHVGVTDNFFELGGHSLLAIRIVSAIRKRLTIELGIKDLFTHATIRQLGAWMDNKNETVPLRPVLASESHNQMPLSFGQERLWFIDQLEGSLQYHIPNVVRLKGNLNRGALSKSIQTIINRHEVLRTVIEQKEGRPYQYALDVDTWRMVVIDETNGEKDKAALQRLIRSLVAAPFDLSAHHMLRAHLIVLDKEDHILVLTMHHIASDDISMPVLVNELKVCYSAFLDGVLPSLPAITVQYKDYAVWQRKYMSEDVLREKLAYWTQQLENTEALVLPTDHPRPSVQSTRGASLRFNIDEKTVSQLETLGRGQGCTLFITLLSAFNVLLHRYSGQDDICVGSPITGRTQQELEGLIGFFINTLALRSDLAGNPTFIELMQRTREVTLNAYDHQDVPFEAVVEAVVKERNLSRTPLFQVMFITRNDRDVEKASNFLEGLTISSQEYDHESSKFDITFNIVEKHSGFEGRVEYSTELFEESTIERMIGHYLQLLQSVVNNPDEKIGLLPMMGEEEKRIIFNFNNTTTVFPQDQTIVDLFHAQLAASPNAAAVIADGATITYGELDRRSNRFCHHLRHCGVKPGDFVPLCIQRGHDMMIAVWGIIKAGAAYVPVDPGFPIERIEYILKDTGARVVVTNSALRSRITQSVRVIEMDKEESAIDQYIDENVEVLPTPDQVAYVIYTSGSTGVPKGVMIEHGSLVNRLKWMQQRYQLSGNDIILHKTPFTFDVSVWELFWWSFTGTSVFLLEPGAEKYCDRMIDVIASHQITVIHFVPSMFAVFLNYVEETNSAERLRSLRQLFTSGEALSSASVKQFNRLMPWCELSNLYGPTEATIDVSWYDCPKRKVPDSIPIGKPIDNTGLYITDGYQQLQPIGVTGELVISGVNLARGYLNREELTQEKFVNVTWLEGKVYRTGDLARWLPDGNIEYLGRMDDQVKIRGYRIELGEISYVLQHSGFVKQCAVITRPDATGNASIIAYVVLTGSASRDELFAYLKERLPEYMVPSVIMIVDHLPVTRNGKLDKNALPDPQTSDILLNSYEAPRNEMEVSLSVIWQEMLEVERIGVYDNFFESGGHSLMIPVLISTIRTEMNVSLVIRDIFTYPTIDKLAEFIQTKIPAESITAKA